MLLASLSVLVAFICGCSSVSVWPDKPAPKGREGVVFANKLCLSEHGPVRVWGGQRNVGVFAFEVGARRSSVSLQRVKVGLGPDKFVYGKVLKAVRLCVDGKVLASSSLNDKSVFQEGGEYCVILDQIRYRIPRDAVKEFVIVADTYSAISQEYAGSITLSIPPDGIRVVDEAGVNQYAPGSGFADAITVIAPLALTDGPRLIVFAAPDSVLGGEISVGGGANRDEIDRVELISFGLQAVGGEVALRGLSVGIESQGKAIPTSAYLFRGDTLLRAVSVSNGVAVFDGIGCAIASNTAVILTVRANIRCTVAEPTSVTAYVESEEVIAKNSHGAAVPTEGGATGNPFKFSTSLK